MDITADKKHSGCKGYYKGKCVIFLRRIAVSRIVSRGLFFCSCSGIDEVGGKNCRSKRYHGVVLNSPDNWMIQSLLRTGKVV